MIKTAFALETDIGTALNALPTNVAGFWRGDLSTLFSNVATAFLIVAVVTSTILLLYGAIRWIISGGDKEGLASAQKRITSALVGLAIAFSIWAIMSLVRHFFGIGAPGGTSTGPGVPGAPAGTSGTTTNGGIVDCCDKPDIYGKNEYTVAPDACKAAANDPQKAPCLQGYRYVYDEVHCDMFYIDKGCWEGTK